MFGFARFSAERRATLLGMKPMAILGLLLIAFGVVALAYGGITYTKRETVLDVGPVHATADREKTIPLSPLAGIVGIVAGAGLLYTSRK